MRRTQIYLDAKQSAELARRASQRGITASKMIREAIDRYLAEPEDDAARRRRFRAAIDESFGAVRRLPDGATYVAELRGADLARERERELRAAERE